MSRPRIALAAFLAVLGASMMPLAPAAAQPCAVATKPAAKALVIRAARHLKLRGPTRAFADFMNPKGGFMDGDLYVWVIDTSGVMVANGRYPGNVGSYLGQGPGGLGGNVLQRALKKGSGWVRYRWYSPCTGRVEDKVAYFQRQGKFVVGAGAYPKPGV